MTPDPQRQWFVYFKEQEMGPFSERELQGKTRSGEITDSAYVFTEGMADWASLADTPVLRDAAEAPSAPEAPNEPFSEEVAVEDGATRVGEPHVQVEKLGASAPTQQ